MQKDEIWRRDFLGCPPGDGEIGRGFHVVVSRVAHKQKSVQKKGRREMGR
jgi:hypothetical protein